MAVYTTEQISKMIQPVAKQYGMDKVYLFGSYARGDATDSSDIDFYVEFTNRLGLKFCSFVSDMEQSVGKKVDIITKDGLYNPTTLKSNQLLIKNITRERKCIYG